MVETENLPLLRAHVTVAVLVVCAIALALVLVPDAAELGSHLTSDREGQKARVYLEKALTERGNEREIVIPLAKIYSDAGEHGTALALLGRLKPAELGRQEREMRLRELREAGRTAQYLQELQKQQQTPDQLAEIAQIFGQNQQLELQEETLTKLLALRPDDLQLTRTLAHLQARVGQPQRAKKLLESLWNRDPTALTGTDFAQLVQLRVELDPSDAALTLVEQHAQHFPEAGSRLELAQRFYRAGRFDETRHLLDPLIVQENPETLTLETWARAMLALGQVKEAAAILHERLGHAELGRVTSLLCEVALQDGDVAMAAEIAGNAQFRNIDPPILLWLAQALASAKQLQSLRPVLAALEDETLQDDPVGAAHLYWQAGLKAKATLWAQKAQESPGLTAAQQLWLAELYLEMNRRVDAAHVLQKSTETPELALRLALLWWRTEVFAPGLKAFATPQLPGEKAGRALLLAGAGQTGQALKLLETPQFVQTLLTTETANQPPRTPRGQARAQVLAWLQALAQSGIVHKNAELTAFSFRAQLELRPGDRALQLALAEAEVQRGRPLEALEVLHGLALPLLPSERTTLRQTLLAAHRAKLPVQEELIREALAYLQTANLHAAEAQSWVHLLLELKATREALPYVARLAAQEGGAWQARQVELLKGLGDMNELVALWKRDGLDAARTQPVRLDAANNLLLAGQRPLALTILQSVAEQEPAESAVVQQLLSLWGPRPGPQPIAWLVARAQKATGAQKVAWLRQLLWVGAPQQVLTLVGPEPDDALLEVTIDALEADRQWKTLSALAEKRAQKLENPELLAHLAETCAAHGQKHAAEVAFVRLTEVNPQAPQALHWLAQITSGQRALHYWQAFFALPAELQKQTSWRDRLRYGEQLLAEPNRAEEGRQQLQIALRLVQSENLPTHERDREAGRLLTRLGRTSEAIPLLERALTAKPCDHALRADVVAALMAVQQLEKAESLVDPPAQCHGP